MEWLKNVRIAEGLLQNAAIHHGAKAKKSMGVVIFTMNDESSDVRAELLDVVLLEACVNALFMVADCTLDDFFKSILLPYR